MFPSFHRRKQRIAPQPTTPQRDDTVMVDSPTNSSGSPTNPRKRQQQQSQQQLRYSSSSSSPPSSPPLYRKHSSSSSPVLSFSSSFLSPFIMMKHRIVRFNNYRRRNMRDRILLLVLSVLTCTVLLVQIFVLTDRTNDNNNNHHEHGWLPSQNSVEQQRQIDNNLKFLPYLFSKFRSKKEKMNHHLRNLSFLSSSQQPRVIQGALTSKTITGSNRIYPPIMVYLDSSYYDGDVYFLSNNNSSNLNTTASIATRARKSLSYRKLYNTYSTFRRRKSNPSETKASTEKHYIMGKDGKFHKKLQHRPKSKQTYPPPTTTILKQIPHNILAPDYNGLLIPSMLIQYYENEKEHENNKKTSSLFQRTIDSLYDDYRLHLYRDELLTYWDEEIYVSTRYDFYDDLDHPQQCTRPQWTYSYHPNCLSFHEIVDPALSSISGDNIDINDGIVVPSVEYLAHGYYRDTWVFHDHNQMANGAEEVYAVKHLRMWLEQDIKSLEKIKIEALVQERLTGSPVITQLYGHCGTSTMVEMANELTFQIVPYVEEYMMERGRIEQRILNQLEKKGPHSFNNFTILEKLNIAIAMAEGLAQEHGYRESVIVNDDAHPDQWLITNDGRYILNDMNNAVFLRWDFQKQRYCKYYSEYGGDFRAPEEYHDDGSYVDESVDIWPMGNLIFTLLTGLWPYYTMTSSTRIQKVTMQGKRPYLHPGYKTRSYIERRMIEVMDKCHVLEPKDRVSIFDVLEHLYETRKHYHRKIVRIMTNSDGADKKDETQHGDDNHNEENETDE